MASIICKTPRHLLSKTFYSTLSSSPKPLPFPSFEAVKSAILTESNPEKLAQLFSHQSTEFARFRRYRPIFDLAVHKLSRSNRHDLIHQILETQKIPPQTICPMLQSEGFWIRLIMLYSKSGMVDDAMRTFDQMPEFKCARTEKSLCAILTVYLDNGKFDKVHELFKTLPVKIGVSPCVKLHNLILRTFCKENNVESAKMWVDNMEGEYKVEPDIESYNVLLGAYTKGRNRNGFDGIVKEISRRGLECNVAAYNYRIWRLCKTKECVRANKLLDEMVSKGLTPNPSCYNAIIYGFCKVGDFEWAKKVLERMLADGYVSPNSFTYNTLIESMVKDGEFDLALEICKEIIRRKWVPPFDTMAGLVEGLVKMSKAEEAKEVVENMKKRLKGPALDSWGKIEAGLPL